MKHQGVLKVSRELLQEVKIPDVLPEGHSVIAVRDVAEWPWVEHLIEGHHMPTVEEGTYPENVTMVVRQEAADGRVTARFASWAHQPGVEWPIGLVN